MSEIVVFNSPPAPVGFDANPAILFEAMMNGKTFIAQAGTPILRDIGHLGLVVETDEEWLRAAETFVFDEQKRKELEQSCYRAYKETYNFANMMTDIEGAIQDTIR